MSAPADERESISIIQAMEEADKGLIDLKEVSLKNRQTNITTIRYFWNRTGHKGSLYIHIGDMTKPETAWPFLLREPSKHPDQGDDVSTLGAFTAIPDPEEMAAFVRFREWMLQRIFEKKVIKGKKGESLDSVRTEVAQLGMVPEVEGQHFCFNQKLQPGGSIESLRTQAFLVYASKGPDGTTEYEEGPALDVSTLRASNTIFTTFELGELKKSQGKYRSCAYTRKLVCVREKTEPVQETSFRIGGVVVKRRDAVAVLADDVSQTERYDTSLHALPSATFAPFSEPAFAVPTADTTLTPVTVLDKKTFGDAVAEDIARLSAATTLKRPAAALTAPPITVALLPEDSTSIAASTSGSKNDGGVPTATKRVRTQ